MDSPESADFDFMTSSLCTCAEDVLQQHKVLSEKPAAIKQLHTDIEGTFTQPLHVLYTTMPLYDVHVSWNRRDISLTHSLTYVHGFRPESEIYHLG